MTPIPRWHILIGLLFLAMIVGGALYAERRVPNCAGFDTCPIGRALAYGPLGKGIP